MLMMAFTLIFPRVLLRLSHVLSEPDRGRLRGTSSILFVYVSFERELKTDSNDYFISALRSIYKKISAKQAGPTDLVCRLTSVYQNTCIH